MPSIVQFLHPGPEHRPNNPPLNNHINWNIGNHRRKFLKSRGYYVSNGNLEPVPVDLVFWGEWEPPSCVQELNQNNNPLNPRWLHTPYVPIPIPNHHGLQNTDPHVFENEFKYLLCQQYRPGNLNLTQLSHLEAGSLILFGSKKTSNNQDLFLLDTVFVIAEATQYNPFNDPLLPPLISDNYFNIVYSKAYANDPPNLNLNLYQGATFHNQFKGMYSFVPAQIYTNGQNHGFPRVSMHNLPLPYSNYINVSKTQGFKITNGLNINHIINFWNYVLCLSQQHHCVEAVQLNHPNV